MAWITTSQAARLSGYNRDWIRRLCHEGGHFTVEKVDARWHIDEQSFLLFVEQQKKDQNGRAGPRE